MHAAVNANCLADQSGAAYWSFVDYVHEHAGEISGAGHDVKPAFATLDKLAHEQGERSKLDLVKLDSCTAKQDQSAVEASMKQGSALGVNGTPTIFINGERISGMLPAPTLWIAVDRALKSAGVPAPPPANAAESAEGTGSAQPRSK
jgi:protein-disulfide isomerase